MLSNMLLLVEMVVKLAKMARGMYMNGSLWCKFFQFRDVHVVFG